jgi:hypothetical protein
MSSIKSLTMDLEASDAGSRIASRTTSIEELRDVMTWSTDEVMDENYVENFWKESSGKLLFFLGGRNIIFNSGGRIVRVEEDAKDDTKEDAQKM